MLLLHAVAAALCSALAAHALPATAAGDLAPLLTPTLPATPASDGREHTPTLAHIVDDSYIVVLDDSLSDHDVDQHHAHVDHVHRTHEATTSATTTSRRGIKHRFHVGGKRHHRRHAAQRRLRGYAGSFDARTVDQIRAMKGVKYVERDSLVWASDIEKGAPWVRYSLLTCSDAASSPPRPDSARPMVVGRSAN